MKDRLLALVLLALLAACGTDGAPKYSGTTPTPEELYGQCAFCHNDIAVNLIATGGHGNPDFRCEFCHGEDLTPGTVGPGHRNVPACLDCHQDQMTHHDPAAGTKQECTVCHTPHGSSNLYLVNEQVTTPSGAVHDVQFTVLAGLADGGLASASDPGTGLCETCHTRTLFYRSDGTGDDHFPYPCFTCHPHALGFHPRP